ncbi:hypothetical protein ACKWTF_004368 [Chironomus riparius]
MLRNRITNSIFVLRNRNFSVSSSLSTDKQNVPSYRQLSEVQKRKLDEDKEKLIWRNKPLDQPYAFKSKFNVFGGDELEPSSLSMLVQPIDASPRGIKKWWKDYKVRKERFSQQFIPERHEILGSDLAAAHFLLFRKGKVKFIGQDWLEMNTEKDLMVPLPNKFNPHYEIEAIKCDNMVLYYEGLENIRRLRKLRYLSFKNVKTFDDWCLDRVSGSEFEKLEILDISDTNVTANGLQALYRISSLKKLIVTHPETENPQWTLTLAMLQDIFPSLETSSSNQI